MFEPSRRVAVAVAVALMPASCGTATVGPEALTVTATPTTLVVEPSVPERQPLTETVGELVDDADSPTGRVAPAGAVRASDLFAACADGAALWSGVVIAAFEDPAVEGGVVCWADGEVPKSPPPGANGEVYPSFDRLTFAATLDGTVVRLLTAGYRDQMEVHPPDG